MVQSCRKLKLIKVAVHQPALASVHGRDPGVAVDMERQPAPRCPERQHVPVRLAILAVSRHRCPDALRPAWPARATNPPNNNNPKKTPPKGGRATCCTNQHTPGRAYGRSSRRQQSRWTQSVGFNPLSKRLRGRPAARDVRPIGATSGTDHLSCLAGIKFFWGFFWMRLCCRTGHPRRHRRSKQEFMRPTHSLPGQRRRTTRKTTGARCWTGHPQ